MMIFGPTIELSREGQRGKVEKSKTERWPELAAAAGSTLLNKVGSFLKHASNAENKHVCSFAKHERQKDQRA